MQDSGSDRAQTLWGIAAARDVYDVGKDLASAASSGNLVDQSGVSLKLGYSQSKSESESETHVREVVGSHLSSGGDTIIVARGQSDGEGGALAGTGNLNIVGSTVEAGGSVILAANNDINLLSAEETYQSSSRNSSSSSGIGVSVGIGGTPSVGLEISGGKLSGSGNADGVTHVETVIRAGDTAEFASVNDTTLRGAQIIGDTVIGTVGGDLTIISEQDTYNETINQSSSGFGLSLGTGSVGGNASTQKQHANSDYASVSEQSGIFAGEGGFDIAVGGNTGLVGGVIDSQTDDNILITGTLTTEDIANNSSYEATTKGWGVEFSYEKGGSADSETANKGSITPALPMKESGGDSSVTKSAVAEGTVIITDGAGQLALTGETAAERIASLNRDTDNAHAGPLVYNPDLQEILDRQAELAEAAAAAGVPLLTTQFKSTGSNYFKPEMNLAETIF